MKEEGRSGAVYECGYVPVRDGTRLAYVVWRRTRSGKYPTLLCYSIYGQSGSRYEEVERFLAVGYAYVGANVRGTGASEGVYSYYQPIEGDDGADIVEWVASQSWSDGNVGMIGASYGGHTQVLVASRRPAHLRAIVPVSTEGDEYRDEAMTGGLFNCGLLAQWTYEIQPERARNGVEERARMGDINARSIQMDSRCTEAYHEVMQHPLYDEWWRVRSLEEVVGQIRVPTLIIHGWQDEWIRPNGAIRLFKLLRCGPKRIVLQNGPHKLSQYDLNHNHQMQWLDRWVRGVKNGAEMEPAVTVHWEVEHDSERNMASPSWSTCYPCWPVPGISWRRLFLTGSHELSDKMPAQKTEVLSYCYPVGTELVGTLKQFAQRPCECGSISYRTEEMKKDVVLLGSPLLTIFFSSDAEDTDFMFTLKDIDFDGNVLFLQRSVVRAGFRSATVDVNDQNELIQSFGEIELLEAGKVYKVEVSLSTIGHVIREGHCLELSVLAPNVTPCPVWSFVPTSGSCVNRVYHGSDYPSSLCLPVVPGEVVGKTMPKLGALLNQPFRGAG